MTWEKDRMARAGNYVLGLMDDGERARAERDLEVDPGFRDAVLLVAERLHLLDLKPIPDRDGEDFWRTICTRIAALPQMRSADEPVLARAGQPDGRAARMPPAARRPARRGLHSVPDARAGVIAMAMIAACAVGYAAGVSTAGFW